MTALHIPTPCHENWDAMAPRDGGRHCASCAKTVVDLTGLGPGDSRRALARIQSRVAAHQHVCVRAPADAAGRVVLPSVRRRLLTNGLAVVLAMVISGDLAIAADSQDPAQGTAPTVQVDPASTQGGSATPAEPVQCTTGLAMPLTIPLPATASATAAVPVESPPGPDRVTTGVTVMVPEMGRAVPRQAPSATAPAH